VRVRLTGSGFLRHVVRNLVGALAQVGSGRLAPGAVAEMLAAGRRLYAGPKAPAGGLYLSRVFYGEPGGKAGGEPGG
jgi:tRNA pseudouridine38-40 synthase